MPPSVLVNFQRNLVNLDYTRKRMEKLYIDDRIVLRDLHSVYESLFLRGVTGFELFIQDLFVSILGGSTRYRRRGVSLKMRPKSQKALMDILMQGDKYLDWLPINRTIERANIYLEDGRPFSEIGGDDRSTITTITIIRNAIAHKSAHSARMFDEKVIGSRSLLRGEKTPAGYLRSQLRTSPIQNRYEVYMAALAQIASRLC